MYDASNEEEEDDNEDDEKDDHEHHNIAKLGSNGLSVVELFLEDLLLNLFWVVGGNDLLVVSLAAVELLQESGNQNKENDWDGGEDERDRRNHLCLGLSEEYVLGLASVVVIGVNWGQQAVGRQAEEQCEGKVRAVTV